MVGLTDSGLVTPSIDEVFTSYRDQASFLFQDLVESGDVVNTGSNTTIGRIIGVATPAMSDLWEAIAQVYSAFDPETATDKELENICAYQHIFRKQASYSTCQNVLFGGSNGTQILAGNQVYNSATAKYWSLQALVDLTPSNCFAVDVSVRTVADGAYSITITKNSTTTTYTFTASGNTEQEIVDGIAAALVGASGIVVEENNGIFTISGSSFTDTLTVTVTGNLQIDRVVKAGNVIAKDIGAVEAPIGTLTSIATPVLGWDYVYNPFGATVGEEKETDDILRLRFRNSKFERAANIYEALYTSVMAVDGVDSAQIYENDTGTVNSLGIPPHSFSVVVTGGEDIDVAKAIYNNGNLLGIDTYGTTSITITDTRGWERVVNFQRPLQIPIYVTLYITTDDEWEGDGEDQIKQALSDYISNIGVGNTVFYSRLFTPINSVKGFSVNSMFTSTSPSPGSMSNIPIAYNQIPVGDTSYIEVVIE